MCSPTRAAVIISEIDALGWRNKTKLVYEPIPDMCIPSEMPALRKVLPRIHYFSPNHEEAGTFYGLNPETEHEESAKMQRIAELAQRYLHEGAPDTVIIRAGKLGAYAKKRDGTKSLRDGVWIPPYHQSPDRVVDVTGAGNAFLVSPFGTKTTLL